MTGPAESAHQRRRQAQRDTQTALQFRGVRRPLGLAPQPGVPRRLPPAAERRMRGLSVRGH